MVRKRNRYVNRFAGAHHRFLRQRGGTLPQLRFDAQELRHMADFVIS